MIMEIGKLPADVLENLVLKPLTENKTRKDVVIRPATGRTAQPLIWKTSFAWFQATP